MAKLIGEQLSLIAESEFEDRSVGDWDYDDIGIEKVLNRPILTRNINNLVPPAPTESPQQISDRSEYIDRVDEQKLGTKEFLVPNSDLPELGTKEFLVPNSDLTELGTEIFLVPNSDNWKPPVGCFQQKWIKDHQYWYWRYYKTNGKKRSKYLHKDYDKAVRKAMKIGVPTDAKLPKPTTPKADPQAPTARAKNISDIAQTAHGASRTAIAA